MIVREALMRYLIPMAERYTKLQLLNQAEDVVIQAAASKLRDMW